MAGVHAFLDAGVDPLVEDDGVVPVRQGGEQREVGEEAGGEVERRLAAEEAGGERFQFGMRGLVAAQQSGTGGTGRSAGVERIDHGPAQRRVARRGRGSRSR